MSLVSGPLTGLRVVELAGLGPAPFAGMVLADLGADVVVVHRPGERIFAPSDPSFDVLNRGKRSVVLDMKSERGLVVAHALIARSHVLIEGFRPGVAERLGFGPDEALAANPSLVYGRMTGWGQDGPWAQRAGHDLDYFALTGALWATGRAASPPSPPLNLVADFGGGSMLLVVGVLAALLSVRAGGAGQVVDAAMVDGASLLSTLIWGLRAQGAWIDEREANLLDGGAPFYDTYVCADGQFLAVAALEPAFFAELVERLGVDLTDLAQYDRDGWPELRRRIAERIACRSRDEWTASFENSDACVAPVLTWVEAPEHPQLSARGTFTTVAGVRQPSPAPRFSATPAGHPEPARQVGADTADVLAELGLPAD